MITTDYFRELCSLLGETHCANVTVDKFNELINEGFPRDALEFLAKYDGGLDDYIWLISPLHPDWQKMIEPIKQSYLSLQYHFETKILPKANSSFISNGGYPFRLYPEENGLLPWAQCDNGTVFYWRINGGKWTILVYGESWDFWEFEMTTTEFLYKLITRQINYLDLDLPNDLFENGRIIYFPR